MRNSVQLIGNLGHAPNVRTLENGNTVATFSLATADYYINSNGERVEDTQWHNIVVWGRKAEIAEQYLFKGSKLALEGKLVYRTYLTAKGETRYTAEVVVRSFTMIGEPPKKTDKTKPKKDPSTMGKKVLS